MNLTRKFRSVIVIAGASFAVTVSAATPRARADVGALMSVGAAFIGAEDIDRIAGDLNFGSLSPGIDGGVVVQMGNIDRGWSGAFGLDAFWSRRRLDDVNFPDDSGPARNDRSSFSMTAVGFPASVVYARPRMGGRLWAGAGIGYYAVTVQTTANIDGSNVFPNDGSTEEGERSADGFGLHATLGFERATRAGGIGGGVRGRLARFANNEVRGSSNFDADLSGVSIFLSYSVRQAKK
ncbi:MAG: hypothetical protein ACKVU1_18320 [bacterium]